MNTTFPTALLIGTLLVATAGCATQEKTADTGQTVSLDMPAFGLTVTGFEEFAASLEYKADGSVEMVGDASVTIDGLGTHEISVAEFIDPAAKGARETLFVTDETTKTDRFFHYDPGDNAVVVGGAKGGVFVFQNPDGTYDVVEATFDDPPEKDKYTHAPDGYAAYELVKNYKEFSNTSPHAMLMAYALAQHAAPESRGSPCGDICVGATPPQVCGIFKAFCDCVACDFSGLGDNCALCPKN
ncbi:MAG: hypothetical protein KC502_17540 [Myxococcales bacterium]|nr:hypothetical protein [Myxococcales bacterium]